VPPTRRIVEQDDGTEIRWAYAYETTAVAEKLDEENDRPHPGLFPRGEGDSPADIRGSSFDRRDNAALEFNNREQMR
jgi:hypothetical protein